MKENPAIVIVKAVTAAADLTDRTDQARQRALSNLRHDTLNCTFLKPRKNTIKPRTVYNCYNP